MPLADLPRQWFITTANGQTFVARADSMVRVHEENEGGGHTSVGQVTDAPHLPDPGPVALRYVGLALPHSLPAALFHEDAAPSPTREKLVALLDKEFVDTVARRAKITQVGKVGPLPPSSPLSDIHVWHASIPETADTLYEVQGERHYPGAEITIFDFWALLRAGQLAIVRRRGPDTADGDYKGGFFEEPFALFRHDGRTMVVFNQSSYTGNVWLLAQVSDGQVRLFRR